MWNYCVRHNNAKGLELSAFLTYNSQLFCCSNSLKILATVCDSLSHLPGHFYVHKCIVVVVMNNIITCNKSVRITSQFNQIYFFYLIYYIFLLPVWVITMSIAGASYYNFLSLVWVITFFYNWCELFISSYYIFLLLVWVIHFFL